MTTSFDHSIIDGAPATRFLNRLMQTIRDGQVLVNQA
ncbi:MAG: 2-oxo acid dehydrogenase subunit E2 [Saprospiraceae bacterium]|nr:2-oxo acid dehydrogenase subunit E2 [Saprospiraceae bacterium]